MRLPSFELLNNALQAQEFGNRLSELHGFACGTLAVDLAYPLDTCVGILAPDLQNVVFNIDLQEQLDHLYEVTRAQMTDPVLQLDLYLPGYDNEDEDINLSRRVAALASWCDGYLFGLANAGLQEHTELPSDTAEIISDLSRISQLKGADTGEEDEELSYVELLEYVRMSALLVAEELQPIKMTTEIQ
ncbi:MAG: UPF0149 family protein [Pseudomonadota bacterium]